MTRSTKEKWLIALLSPLVVSAVIALSTNILNAASENDLANVKKECIKYTDTKIKVHEEKEELRFQTLEKMEKRVEFLYLRELEKADKALYIKELIEINKRDAID